MTAEGNRGREAASGPAPVPRRLGAWSAVLLVIASMVGTGVFTTSGLLVGELQSTSAVLLVWLLGGLLALCGALSYAELTAALPRNGGEYRLLSRIYHPAVGFAAGWVSLVVGFSAPLAAGALAFGLYLQAVLPGTDPTAAAVVLTLALTALHAVHVTVGSSLHNVFTAANILLVLVFLVGGAVAGSPGAAFSGGARPLQEAVFSPAFAVALVFVSFAYSGWNGAAYLAGEVRNPARSLPRALLLGTGLVVLLYVGLNLVFLSAAPPGELSGVVEIGHLAARRLFGEQAGAVLTGAIALALVSSGSAMMMAGPRVYHAMGEDYAGLSFLRYRTRRGGPASAVMLQGAAALVMVLSSSFDALLTYLGITLSLSAGLTVAGVLVLRAREPDLARPYRTWGYPLTPLLFLGLSSWMIVHAVSQRPIVALAGAATVVSGLLLYLPLARGRRAAPEQVPPSPAAAGTLAPRTG
ncbi:MAG: amino acid permease [Deltaproteobacteria bacterium]|nr:amino acid permease [Deltaproteobacteria bacterium]